MGDAVVPDQAARGAWYSQWLQTVRETATGGALLWMLGCRETDTRGFTDSFAIHEAEEAAELFPQAPEVILG